MEVLERHLSLERSGVLSLITQSHIPDIYFELSREFNLKASLMFKLNLRNYDLARSIFNVAAINIDFEREEVILYTVSSLLLASGAVEELSPDPSNYRDIIGQGYTNKNILEAHVEIYKVLNYNIYLPLGSYFLELIVMRLKEYDIAVFNEILNISLYYYYISTLEKDLDRFLPSAMAASSLYLGFLNENIDISDILFDILDYDSDSIKFISYRISQIYKDSKDDRSKPLYKLFTSKDEYRSKYRINNIENLYIMDNVIEVLTDHLLIPDYRDIDVNTDDNIEIMESIGRGGYSEVFKVKFNGEFKALKKMTCSYKGEGINDSDVKELSILKLSNSSNIIECSHISISIMKNTSICSQVVLELLEMDLYKLYSKKILSLNLIKRYSLQLFNAVKYLNDLGIIHGDIKPRNILVKGEDIKLADFGLSLLYVLEDESKPQELYTYQYRPVELLLEKTRYSYEVDIWACGVTMVEIIRRDFVFEPTNEDDMIKEMVEVVGVDDSLEYLSNLPGWSNSYVYDSDQNISLTIENNMKSEEVEERLYIDEEVKRKLDIYDEYDIFALVMNYILTEGHEELEENLKDLPDWEDWYLYISDVDILEYVYDDEEYGTEDELLLDLLRNMITVPEKRYTVEQCINHPWFMT